MKKVRLVYLVSKDREPKRDFQEAIEYAVTDVQWWYRQQLGVTFASHGRTDVIRSSHNGSHFGSHEASKHGDSAYYINVMNELSKTGLGVRQNHAHYCWAVYCDAPGNKGRGGDGLCIMPRDDLLGLTGQMSQGRERWRGGLAHELGHAFGLPHPKDTKTHSGALMWLGYTTYPKTYLSDADKLLLLKSEFFPTVARGAAGRAPVARGAAGRVSGSIGRRRPR